MSLYNITEKGSNITLMLTIMMVNMMLDASTILFIWSHILNSKRNII